MLEIELYKATNNLSSEIMFESQLTQAVMV